MGLQTVDSAIVTSSFKVRVLHKSIGRLRDGTRAVRSYSFRAPMRAFRFGYHDADQCSVSIKGMRSPACAVDPRRPVVDRRPRRSAANCPNSAIARRPSCRSKWSRRSANSCCGRCTPKCRRSAIRLLKYYTETQLYSLAEHSELRRKQLFPVLIDAQEVNAFAAPGGVVGINLGLYLAARGRQRIFGGARTRTRAPEPTPFRAPDRNAAAECAAVSRGDARIDRHCRHRGRRCRARGNVGHPGARAAESTAVLARTRSRSGPHRHRTRSLPPISTRRAMATNVRADAARIPLQPRGRRNFC